MPLESAEVLLPRLGALPLQEFEHAGHVSAVPFGQRQVHVRGIEVPAAVEFPRFGQVRCCSSALAAPAK